MKKHPYLYSLSVIILLWWIASFSNIKYLQSPYETFLYIVLNGSVIIRHIAVSMARILTAIFVTMIFGSIAGISLGRSQGLDRYLTPFFYTLYPVPKIAFLPLLILAFGIGNGSKIALVVLILFFQIVLSIRDAVKAIPSFHFLSIKTMYPSQLQVYKHLIIPAILPALFTALRISIGTGLSVLFFSENYATQYGIGYYIMDNWMKMDYTGMFAGIVSISMMGIFLFGVIDQLERHLCPWNVSTQ